MTISGQIFNIQRFSIHDGPGVRTTVFLKGCPLRCIWCHNPESKEEKPEISFYDEKCLLCGACAAVCPEGRHVIGRKNGDENGAVQHRYNREGCLRCGRCGEVCPPGALSVIGRTAGVEDVIAEVKRDEPFYKNSGGGMTLSGGEPFFQAEFTLALLALARKEKIHTCVETSGAAPEDVLLKATENTGLFLYDIKETDPERHKTFTGGELDPIIRNLKSLDAAGAAIILRCPVIPGCNDREDHFRGIGALADKLKNVDHIDVEPYHPLGLSKAAGIGKQAGFQETVIPSREQAEAWVETLQKWTTVRVVLL
jgi:pyruvate formate lyase activating enzyme